MNQKTEITPEQRTKFYETMDAMICAGHASQHIANMLGICPVSVRKRRKMLRLRGLLPQSTIEAINARHIELRSGR